MLKTILIFLVVGFVNIACANNYTETYLAKKGSNVLVITGINHGQVKEIWPPSQSLMLHFKQATKIFVELDFTDLKKMKEIEKIGAQANDLAIQNFLTEMDIDKIFNVASENLSFFKISKNAFREAHACLFAPLFLPAVKSVKSVQEDENEKNKSVPSYEQFFLSHAKRLSKEIQSLESDGSLKSCEQLSKSEVSDLLLSPMLLYKDEKKKNEYLELQRESSKAFNDGFGQKNYDLAMQAISFDSSYKHGFQKWMSIRNNNMVRQLALELAKPANEITFFVLVGSLHLYGEQGILAILKNDGFVVEKSYK